MEWCVELFDIYHLGDKKVVTEMDEVGDRG